MSYGSSIATLGRRAAVYVDRILERRISMNLDEGDVLMQLLDREGKQVIWIRLLRRIGNTR